jgi:hypothetical protein
MCYLSLSIYIFISIYLSNYLSICLSVWLSVCLSILSYPIQANLSIHPSIHLSIYLSLYIYTFISIHLYLYIYIDTFTSLHLYLYIYIYLSFFFLIYIYVCIFTVKHLLIWIHRTLQLLDQVRLDVAAARARSKATLQAGRNRSPCLARHWGMVSYWVYRGFTMGLPHHHITIYHLPSWELKQTTLLDTNGLGRVGLACGRVPLAVFDLNHGRIISSFSFNPKKHETPTWDSLVLFKRYLRSRDRKDHDGR